MSLTHALARRLVAGVTLVLGLGLAPGSASARTLPPPGLVLAQNPVWPPPGPARVHEDDDDEGDEEDDDDHKHGDDDDDDCWDNKAHGEEHHLHPVHFEDDDEDSDAEAKGEGGDAVPDCCKHDHGHWVRP